MNWLHRIPLAAGWLFLAAASVFWAGCSTNTNATITRPNADAYARAVNLGADDVPDMKSFANGFAIKRSIFGVSIERCGGIIIATPPYSVNSPRFRTMGARGALKSEAVHSAIYFAGSGAIASRDITVFGSERFRTCLQRYRVLGAAGRPKFHREVFEKDIEVSSLNQSSASLGVFGLRVSGTLAATYVRSKTRRPFFEDVLGFAAGPVVIILRAEGTPRPVPPSTERRLLTLLEARARAHEL